MHAGVQSLVRDLNKLYRATPALHVNDCEPQGFRWINSDAEQSTLGFLRLGEEGDAPVLVMCNFTPVERNGFRVGVPEKGHWAEVLNSDSALYGGGNRGNLGGLDTVAEPSDGFGHSIEMTLPPLSVVILRLGE